MEIKEIIGSDEEKLTVAEINWAKLVNSKIEDEEISLEEELAIAGINDGDGDHEDEEDEEDEDDEEDEEDDEDEEDEGDGGDEEDEEGGGDEEDEEGEEKINIENLQDNAGNQLEDAPVNIWTHGIEDNFNNDEDEISDNEEGAKIYIFQDKKYYVEDKENGKIFENIEGKLGKVVGRLEDGVPFFS